MDKEIKGLTRNPLPQIVVNKEIIENYPNVKQYLVNILNLFNSSKGGVLDINNIRYYFKLIKETLPLVEFYRLLNYNIFLYNNIPDRIFPNPDLVREMASQLTFISEDYGFGFILDEIRNIDETEFNTLLTNSNDEVELNVIEGYKFIVLNDKAKLALDYYLKNGKLSNTYTVSMINTILRKLFEMEKELPTVRYMALLEYATLTFTDWYSIYSL